jgi:hypothetical protein
MVRVMFGRFLARRVAALLMALGVFLSGAAPALAMPTKGSMPSTSMMMSDMAMQDGCAGMAMPDKDAPAKQAPCKSNDGSCAVCAGCAVNIGLTAEIAPAALLHRRDSGVFIGNVNPDGIASPPALPPPILRA